MCAGGYFKLKEGKEVEIYLGYWGAKFDFMPLQSKNKKDNEKTKKHIKNELQKMTKKEIINSFIEFLATSNEFLATSNEG